jgi:hypothetical protein
MTSVSQDFTTYAGDAAAVTFTVTDGTNPIDLSGVQEIEWDARRDLDSAIVLQKTKTGGGITLVGGGSGGQFLLSLTGADTSPLTAYYIHQAVITDAQGNVSTVTLGRMQVGRAPIATYSGDPRTSAKDQVRFWVQDTAAPFKVYDGEINYTLSLFTNPMLAAANVARSLAAKYAALPSKRVGDFQLSWGELTKNYTTLANTLESQAQTFDIEAWSGGIRKTDVAEALADQNRVRPPFRRDQFDNPNGVNNTSDPAWDFDTVNNSL